MYPGRLQPSRSSRSPHRLVAGVVAHEVAVVLDAHVVDGVGAGCPKRLSGTGVNDHISITLYTQVGAKVTRSIRRPVGVGAIVGNQVAIRLHHQYVEPIGGQYVLIAMHGSA